MWTFLALGGLETDLDLKKARIVFSLVKSAQFFRFKITLNFDDFFLCTQLLNLCEIFNNIGNDGCRFLIIFSQAAVLVSER